MSRLGTVLALSAALWGGACSGENASNDNPAADAGSLHDAAGADAGSLHDAVVADAGEGRDAGGEMDLGVDLGGIGEDAAVEDAGDSVDGMGPAALIEGVRVVVTRCAPDGPFTRAPGVADGDPPRNTYTVNMAEVDRVATEGGGPTTVVTDCWDLKAEHGDGTPLQPGEVVEVENLTVYFRGQFTNILFRPDTIDGQFTLAPVSTGTTFTFAGGQFSFRGGGLEESIRLKLEVSLGMGPDQLRPSIQVVDPHANDHTFGVEIADLTLSDGGGQTVSSRNNFDILHCHEGNEGNNCIGNVIGLNGRNIDGYRNCEGGNCNTTLVLREGRPATLGDFSFYSQASGEVQALFACSEGRNGEGSPLGLLNGNLDLSFYDGTNQDVGGMTVPIENGRADFGFNIYPGDYIALIAQTDEMPSVDIGVCGFYLFDVNEEDGRLVDGRTQEGVSLPWTWNSFTTAEGGVGDANVDCNWALGTYASEGSFFAQGFNWRDAGGIDAIHAAPISSIYCEPAPRNHNIEVTVLNGELVLELWEFEAPYSFEIRFTNFDPEGAVPASIFVNYVPGVDPEILRIPLNLNVATAAGVSIEILPGPGEEDFPQIANENFQYLQYSRPALGVNLSALNAALDGGPTEVTFRTVVIREGSFERESVRIDDRAGHEVPATKPAVTAFVTPYSLVTASRNERPRFVDVGPDGALDRPVEVWNGTIENLYAATSPVLLIFKHNSDKADLGALVVTLEIGGNQFFNLQPQSWDPQYITYEFDPANARFYRGNGPSPDHDFGTAEGFTSVRLLFAGNIDGLPPNTPITVRLVEVRASALNPVTGLDEEAPIGRGVDHFGSLQDVSEEPGEDLPGQTIILRLP